ncbi:hypothetical protein DFH11DRAFT_1605496 [Phellopilus nigrolimitatus]|nr:hypothetical protein DFH11DRAFT_1605496 [Phellopilus nigrolimitatus]
MQDITSSLGIHLLSLLSRSSALPVSAPYNLNRPTGDWSMPERDLARARRDNAESKFTCAVYLSSNVDSSTSPSFRMHLIISRSTLNPDLQHLMY